MQIVTALGEGLNSVAAATAVEQDTTPAMQNHNVIVEIIPDASFAGTAKVQGSDDNSTWVDLLTVTNTAGRKASVRNRRYMRANVTARTAGTVSAYLTAST